MVTKWLRCKFTNGGGNAVRKWFNENWQHWRFKNGGEACMDKGFDCKWPHWWYMTVAELSWGNESIEWRIRKHGKSVVSKWPNRIWPGWDFRKIEGSGVKKKLDVQKKNWEMVRYHLTGKMTLKRFQKCVTRWKKRKIVREIHCWQSANATQIALHRQQVFSKVGLAF